MEHITAIVLAAGKGSRMHTDMPKQFLLLKGKPVLYYSLRCFEDSVVDDVILVTGEADQTYCKEQIVEKYGLKKVSAIVSGGSERYWSVRNGLLAAANTDYVLIHDAARPCITPDMVNRLAKAVQQQGACTIAVPVKDTIKRVDEAGYSIDTPARKELWQIQTPQGFSYSELLQAYQLMEQQQDTDITDDTMIVERYLHKRTSVVMGAYSNLKITTPEDLQVAELFLQPDNCQA